MLKIGHQDITRKGKKTPRKYSEKYDVSCMLYSSVYYVRSCFYFFLASREVGFPEHEKIFWCFRPSMFNNCKQVNNETVSNVNFCGISGMRILISNRKNILSKECYFVNHMKTNVK